MALHGILHLTWQRHSCCIWFLKAKLLVEVNEFSVDMENEVAAFLVEGAVC